MPHELRPFALISTFLVMAALVIEVINGRFWLSDFEVYWSAADALIHHEAVYGVAFGEETGFYKYAPVVAMAFAPAALLPYPLAALLHALLIAVALVLVVVDVERTLMRHVFLAYAPRMLLRALLLLVCIAVLLTRELHLGNINLWLVLGAVVAMRKSLEGNSHGAGVLFGLLWLIKPYLLLLAVPLVMRKRVPELAIAAITMVVGLLIPLVVLGPERGWELHQQWFNAMAQHSSYLTSPDTVPALLNTWSGGAIAGVWVGYTCIALAGVGLILLGWRGSRSSSTPSAQARFYLETSTALALVPNLVITDQEHFLFSIPLLAWLVAHFFWAERGWIPLTLFIVALLLYATRSSDLWGSARAGLAGRAGPREPAAGSQRMVGPTAPLIPGGSGPSIKGLRSSRFHRALPFLFNDHVNMLDNVLRLYRSVEQNTPGHVHLRIQPTPSRLTPAAVLLCPQPYPGSGRCAGPVAGKHASRPHLQRQVP
jgi:Glycosyltransferase family 87